MDRVSPRRRAEILSALRKGTVPEDGLDRLAVGLDRFIPALDEEIDLVTGGGAAFKAIRGEYGAGKTFFTRHLAARARARGLATAEVQISEKETPLHRLQTVYRRAAESLRTASVQPSAFRAVLDSWLFAVQSEAAAQDSDRLEESVDRLLEQRLRTVSERNPTFAVALRAYHRATVAENHEMADGLAAWLSGQPHVAASVKRPAGLTGDLDHDGAMSFLQGLLVVLRDAGHPGLLLVLDEVETLQRMRRDTQEKSLNGLRQLMDEIDAGRFPGLYLVITGTPAFFTGRSGVNLLPPLAQRLEVDFTTAARFDNPRAVQIRLPGFTHASLAEVGGRVRDLYADGSPHADRIRSLVDDAYLRELADAVAGRLGGQTGVSPRVYLKKLVADVLDRVDQFEDFDPRRDYALTVSVAELTEEEQAAAGTGAAGGPRPAWGTEDPDAVELDLP